MLQELTIKRSKWKNAFKKSEMIRAVKRSK